MNESTDPTNQPASPLLLKPDRPVGIVGYGAYVPRYRLPATEVTRIWTGEAGGGPVKEKSVPGLDEDVITMSIEAARNALARAGIDPGESARGVGRLGIAPLFGQAQRDGGGRSHRRHPAHPGCGYGICLQGRDGSGGDGDGPGWVGHG